MKSGNVKDLTQAWDLYYHVFRRISKQLPQVGSHGSSRVPVIIVLSLALPEHPDTKPPAPGSTSTCGLWDKSWLLAIH